MGCEAPKNRRNIEAILGRVGFRRKSSNAAGLSSETGCEGEVYILCLDDWFMQGGVFGIDRDDEILLCELRKI